MINENQSLDLKEEQPRPNESASQFLCCSVIVGFRRRLKSFITLLKSDRTTGSTCSRFQSFTWSDTHRSRLRATPLRQPGLVSVSPPAGRIIQELQLCYKGSNACRPYILRTDVYCNLFHHKYIFNMTIRLVFCAAKSFRVQMSRH